MRKLRIVASVTLACAVVVLLLSFGEARLGNAGGGTGCSPGIGDFRRSLDFPYTIKIAPENRLYIHGYEITGEAHCTWAPGDTMRINGLAVLPTPRSGSGRKVLSEGTLESLYKDVPFIAGLVEAGSTWAAASRLHSEKKSQLCLEAGNRYWDVLERTGSDELAARVVLDSLESDLLDPDYQPTVRNRTLLWKVRGRPEESFMMSERPDFEAATRGRGIPSERGARSQLTTFARMLESERKLWVIVVRGSSETLLGGSNAEKALRQIEEALQTGRVPTGPLSQHSVEEILTRRGAGAR